MIRLNLLYRPMRPPLPWQGPAIGILALGAIIQGLAGLWAWAERSRIEQEAERLRGRLVELEQRLEQSPKATGDLTKIAGQLLDRNRWVESRCRSPVAILAKLDQGKQPGLHLVSFEGNRAGGNIRLLANDMDNASRFLQDTLHTNTDRLAVESRTPEGLLLGYSWTE